MSQFSEYLMILAVGIWLLSWFGRDAGWFGIRRGSGLLQARAYRRGRGGAAPWAAIQAARRDSLGSPLVELAVDRPIPPEVSASLHRRLDSGQPTLVVLCMPRLSCATDPDLIVVQQRRIEEALDARLGELHTLAGGHSHLMGIAVRTRRTTSLRRFA